MQNSGGGHRLKVTVAPHTSPAIVAGPFGGWVAAYQDAAHNLWTIDSGGIRTHLDSAVAPGGDPAITILSNGDREVAYAGANGDLWVRDATTSASVSADTGLPLWPGTSPAIAADQRGGWTIAATGDNGWQVALNGANTNLLWTYDAAGRAVNTGAVMAAGTSPAIAAVFG